jgi:hypothetical protein
VYFKRIVSNNSAVCLKPQAFPKTIRELRQRTVLAKQGFGAGDVNFVEVYFVQKANRSPLFSHGIFGCFS